MSHWSADNATKAYLRTIKMGKRGKEPDVAEFISALAGGNNARLMVEVCGSTSGPTTIGLVAAAQQTGGKVICILPGPKEVQTSRSEMSRYLNRVEFVTGDPITLLTGDYKDADFVTVDCNINGHKSIFKAVKKDRTHVEDGPFVVGYNAQNMVPSCSELGGHFLPIGEGLLVCDKVHKDNGMRGFGSALGGKRSKWIVKVDKCTGEEHVFRVTCP
ncbi:uncharacterized protein LOC141594332 [Silene latifolia]|uniref:uncharacterized protein LOC141594332 n=1 Tax=Silene latifolia TaxID=37657 RepID=UPI003D784B8E